MDPASYQIHVGRSETIDDAVGLLRGKSPKFAERGGAEVRVGAVRYPDFITRRAVVLLGPINTNGRGSAIGMASAEEFTAKQAIGPERQTFSIEHLDRASVDELGNVTLADQEETRLYDVRMVPSVMAQDLTEKEKEALRRALTHIGEESIIRYSVLPSLGEKLAALKQLPEFDA